MIIPLSESAVAIIATKHLLGADAENRGKIPRIQRV
jgi:hypothetical protein